MFIPQYSTLLGFVNEDLKRDQKYHSRLHQLKKPDKTYILLIFAIQQFFCLPLIRKHIIKKNVPIYFAFRKTIHEIMKSIS